MLPHVRYEIESFMLVPAHDGANEALLESVEFRRMGHCRLLYNFFSTSIEAISKNPRNNDDVVSEHFGFPPKELYGQERDQLLQRFNKDLFHLTFKRLDRSPETKRWPREKLYPPVATQCRSFIEHIIQTTTIPVTESERDAWRKLRADILGGLPLQQSTANVAAPEIRSIKL